MTVNATKTLNQVLEENPAIYNNVAGYAWNEASQSWEDVGISDATKQLIQEWFGLRTVCDDTKFPVFFKRQIDLCALRYAQLARIELSAFDPLVADYAERQTEETSSRASTSETNVERSGSSSGSNESTSTRTPDLTHTETGSSEGENSESGTGKTTGKETSTGENSGQSSSTDGGSDKTEHSESNSDKSATMQKNAPQSISYAAASSGSLPALDWSYATAQGQTENQGQGTSSDNTNYGKTNTSSNSGSTSDEKNSQGTSEDSKNGTNSESHTSTGHDTGTDTTVQSGSNSGTTSERSNGNTSGTESGDVQRREISTGRGGLTPQEAFRTAVSYLKTSSAWDWMRKQLEVCFLSVYDI